MEYLINTSPTVTFTKPTEETMIVGASLTTDGDYYPLEVDESTSTVIARLPYLDAASSGTLTWEFIIDGMVRRHSELVEVVTPYVSDAELAKIFEEGTDEERRDVESGVRAIINSHCNQDFGLSRETIWVPGQGETALRLPKRILSISGLDTITEHLDSSGVIIGGNGWYLKKKWLGSLGLINEPIQQSQYYGEGFRPGGIISAPSYSSGPTVWQRDYPFSITGEWGYYSVPEPVRQAAKLLVNDYACMEIAYRDRYLESIKAADWRLQYSAEAWSHTGNVRADQLLSDYVIMDWAAI